MKFHGDAATDVHNKEIPKVESHHTCLTEISLDYALNKNGNYYPQVLLKEFKYILKYIRHVNYDFEDVFDSDESNDE